jgi:hypothetical protein
MEQGKFYALAHSTCSRTTCVSNNMLLAVLLMQTSQLQWLVVINAQSKLILETSPLHTVHYCCCCALHTPLQLLSPTDCIIVDHVCGPGKPPVSKALLRAGPRPLLHFKPEEVVAAIVTCGGLCPGLNSVIHYLTETLLQNYGATKVLGVRGGFAGFYDAAVPPLNLTLEAVSRLQHQGGTLLG